MSSIKSAIENILKKNAEKIVKKRATEIYEECVAVGEFAIVQFYEAYVPVKYDRMYSFMNVCSPFINKISSGSNPAYEVGIRVLEGVAGGHKDPDEYVFHGVMEMGVHGTSLIAKSTPPMKVIKDYFAQFG